MTSSVVSDTVVLGLAFGVTAWLVLSTRAYLRRSDEECRMMSEVVSARIAEMLAENERDALVVPLEELDATGEFRPDPEPEPVPEPVVEPVPRIDRPDPFLALKELAAKYRDLPSLRNSISEDLIPALA